MGVSLKINGYSFPVLDYSITEDSTPLAANDTSGSTGLLTATIGAPDPDLEWVGDTGQKWLLDYGHNILLEKSVTFQDTRFGTLSGTISGVSRPSPSQIQISVPTDLNKLNVYNLTARPFRGILGDLIRRYVVAGGFTVAPVIESSLNSRPVRVPGWRGELWYHFKMLAQAHEFDISILNGVPTFRRLRQNEIRAARDKALSGEIGVPTLAQAVEVYQWNNRAIDNELIYPVGGWNPEVEVFNVNAGEVAQYQIELSASVSSIEAPEMQENVAPDFDASSVYTIVANDGLPVPRAQWEDHNGSLTVRINNDTRSLTVRLRGATNIPISTGGYATNFSVALASDESGSRYSTLRIVGTGVAFKKEKKRFRTGVTPRQSGTEIGVTIDNPFLSDKNQVSRAGTRAAVQYAGPVPSIQKDVTHAFGPGVETLGNLSGARLWDEGTKRYYRARSASVSPSGVSARFEDDLTHSDMDGFRIAKTYGQVEADKAGVTYRDDYLSGQR
jgi:hypothetical protein